MHSPTNPPQRQTKWKRRLHSLQNSFRSSFRSKSSHSSKDIKQDDPIGNPGNKIDGKTVTNASNAFHDNEDMYTDLSWRENGAEQKHTKLSNLNKKQDNYKPMSTGKVHSMHGKTFVDGRRRDKWRNHYSNNNLCDIETDDFHDRRINSHFDLTSTAITSKQDHDSAKVKTTLSRPKSLNILSSLFNRSSGQRTNSKPKRGKFRAESSHSTTEQFVGQCSSSSGKDNYDPASIDSGDEFLDTDGSYLNVKRYYSLKRSRASLIFPPTSERNHKPVQFREKSSTFCGVQEPVKFDGPNCNANAVVNHARLAKTRKSPIRKRRTVSLLVPLPSSSLELLQPEVVTNTCVQPLIGTNYTHLRYKGAAISNIRCITRTLSMSKFSNIPSLGVSYVDNNGVEKTLVILNGNATQSCYDLLKHKERLSIPFKIHRGLEKSRELVNMGNSSGRLERSASYGDILDHRGSLKPSSSTPDLFVRRTSYTLTRDPNVKRTKKMSSMLKGLSLKRHTLAVNSKNPKKDKGRKFFGLESHHEKIEQDYNSHLGLRLAGCNSLSRSMDCLSDLQRTKIPPVQGDSDLFSHKVGSNSMNQYETVQPRNRATTNPILDTFASESDGDDSSVASNDSWIDSPNVKTIIIRRGSQPNVKSNSTTADELPSSLPANVEKSTRQWRGPLYNSTPIARMSTLERERSKSAVSDDPEVPPPVRPRIQSLEELSPVTAEVILRKKKSLASRIIRLKHSTSVPGEEYVTENNNTKRYSLGTDTGDLLDGPVPLTAFKSYSTNYLDSEESLNEDGSSTSLVSDKHLSPYVSPLKVSMEDISKSPTIHEEVEKVDESRKSLSRNPRLGRSTGDLSFEPGGTLKRKTSELNPWQVEDMDVPEAFAEALWDHVTMDPEELSFKAGDIITVISMTNIDWWFGQVGELVGWFPAPFVRVRVSQTLDELENHLAPPVRTRRFTNEGMLTRDVVRARVVNEILETEKSYIKNLKDVVEGYLRQAQKRNEMFLEEEIYLLFSNIEEIYTFHQKLLSQMKKCYVKGDPCASQIGAVFLENKLGFNIYSEYCNNHPQAIAEFKILNEKAKYKHFFEACRLLQDMINISLDGFLLTPVQKICKYPLQLAELLKHTHNTHKDYEPVRQALESMKNVAALINERKRKVENISKIAKWQSAIENWEGENVLERSSELIHSGEVYKVFNGTTQERVCFLFDHQLIYCKKDILRKNGLTYKGRIDMDLARVEWLEDGEETYKNEPLHNAWRIFNAADSKWYLVFTKKLEDKEKWKDAFETEKMKAKEEEQSGLSISQSTRRAVMRSASSSIKGRKAAEKREKFLGRSSSQTDFLKSPPSPILRLPPAVSSADFIKEEDAAVKESVLGFLQRTSALRRSFGLRGSKRNHKDKRTSSVF